MHSHGFSRDAGNRRVNVFQRWRFTDSDILNVQRAARHTLPVEDAKCRRTFPYASMVLIMSRRFWVTKKHRDVILKAKRYVGRWSLKGHLQTPIFLLIGRVFKSFDLRGSVLCTSLTNLVRSRF